MEVAVCDAVELYCVILKGVPNILPNPYLSMGVEGSCVVCLCVFRRLLNVLLTAMLLPQ